MIGVMSDSHDNILAIRRAAQFFNQASCDLVIHAGDFIAPFSVKELTKCSCLVKAVFGNCDGERKGLRKAFHSVGEIREAPLVFNHGNRRILISHLDSPVKSYLSSGEYDVIVYGHTHKPQVQNKRKTLVVNPGEAGGWVSGKSTVALLDTQKLTAEIVSL